MSLSFFLQPYRAYFTVQTGIFLNNKLGVRAKFDLKFLLDGLDLHIYVEVYFAHQRVLVTLHYYYWPVVESRLLQSPIRFENCMRNGDQQSDNGTSSPVT